jgi:HEAT repeat protein
MSPVSSDNFLTPELRTVPLERIPTLSTTQLMRLLQHPDPQYVVEARKTLTGRDGFQEPHLKLAFQLYHPVASVREEIVDFLPNTPNIQPTVWLTVLLNDPNDDVRYRAASYLATAGDPAMQRILIDKGKRDTDARIVNLADRLLENQQRVRR